MIRDNGRYWQIAGIRQLDVGIWVLSSKIAISVGGEMAGLLEILATLKAERESLQRDIKKLDSAVEALESLTKKIRGKRQRKLSAGARRRIAAAQKARWAKWKRKQSGQGISMRAASGRLRKKRGGSWGGPLIRQA